MKNMTGYDGKEWLDLSLQDTDELAQVAFGGMASLVECMEHMDPISGGAMLDALADAGLKPGFLLAVCEAWNDEALPAWGTTRDDALAMQDAGEWQAYTNWKLLVHAILLGGIWNGPGHESNGEIASGNYLVHTPDSMDDAERTVGLWPKEYIDVVWQYVTENMGAQEQDVYPFTYDTFRAAWLEHNSMWWGN